MNEPDARPLQTGGRRRGASGNVKEQAGRAPLRLAGALSAIEDGELVIRFTTRPETEKQKDLNPRPSRDLALDDPALAD